jgi:DNA-binding NarL/FixJ family response regulator
MQSQEDWLETLVQQKSAEHKPFHEHLHNIVELLELNNFSGDIVEIVSLRGQGYTYIEIAEKLNLTKDSVRMKMNRSKIAISEIIAKDQIK